MKKIVFIIILLVILTGFYNINNANYSKHQDIKRNLVEHPENLPTKQTAVNTSFWFKNLRADLYWLQTIQYIWWNAISSDYKKYLYHITDLVTELNPYFEHPYLVAQLLLPSYNERYEKLEEKDVIKYEDQAVSLWLKWVENFCPDREKLDKIINENDLQKIWTNEEFKDPCREFMVPYYLAYIYYFYKKDPLEASKYYKIASANTNALWWAKVMAAIMQWKWWNREKSFFMFLNLAKYMQSGDLACNAFSQELENIWVWLFLKHNIALDWKLLKAIEETRNKTFWDFNEEDEEKILSDTECSNYVNKAIRELNLAYVEIWNQKFMNTHPEWLPARHAAALYEEWYLDYLPIDFQQYEDYWIIYEYNYETKNYDYSMWTYD